MKHKKCIVPIFVPHLGCHHHCSFCNQRYITNQLAFDWPKIREETDERLYRLKGQEVELAFFGGSFTAISDPLRKTLLQYGKQKKQEGDVAHIRISTRPDALSVGQIEELKDFGVDFVEIGIQSFSEAVLRKNHRFYTLQKVEEGIFNLKKMNMAFGLQLLYGLAGETEKSMVQSIDKALSYRPQTLRFYPLLVLKDTLLATWYEEGTFNPPEAKSVVKIGAYAYGACLAQGVTLIRVGLYPSESMLKHCVAGFFHPAYRALMESYFFKKSLVDSWQNPFCLHKITAPPAFFHGMVGYEAYNLKQLRAQNPIPLKAGFNHTLDEFIFEGQREKQIFRLATLIEVYREKVMVCI